MNNKTLYTGLIFAGLLLIQGCSQQDASVESGQAEAVNQAVSEPKQPNVLLVVADDLGYTDLGSFGSEISTPNLDALAMDGTRLTQFYTAPTCSPTRSMLLTGVDNHLVGLGTMAEALAPNQVGKPGYEGYLNDRAAFLPKAFGDAGYRTMMAGKWHLGMDEAHSPSARGFDQTFVLLDGGAGHFTDLGIDKMHAEYRENGKSAVLPEDFYSSRFYTDKMISYIDGGRDSGKPFFAYLAYTAPHWPLQAPDDSIAEYEGQYAEGYDVLHAQRVDNAKALGVVSDKSTTIPRLPGQPAWDDLSAEDKKINEREMEIYAAMVDDLDDEFGRLISYLKETGQYDNTIIFFMSDNGAEGASLEREFQRFVPHVEACCDNSYENLGKPDSYVVYGPDWARASVGPAKYYKGRTTEGGIKTPAFIHYPGMTGQGELSNRFVSVKDVMPTLMGLAGVAIPQGYELPVEGHSFLSEKEQPIDMGWELFGNKAYRIGNWKIVSIVPNNDGDGQWHLYNLAEDPGEQNDLKELEPERFKELMQAWQTYEQKNGLVYAQYGQ